GAAGVEQGRDGLAVCVRRRRATARRVHEGRQVMAYSRHEKERIGGLKLPPTAEIVKRLRDYMERTDSTWEEMAMHVGYSSSTLRLFNGSRYGEVADDDTLIREAIFNFLQRNPIEPRRHAQGRLFETEGYKQIRRYVTRACEHGEVALIYGPPGV